MTQWIAGVDSDRGSIPVWAGFVGAPLLWAAHFQLGYMLVPWLCKRQQYWVMHALTLLFLAASAWCIYLCWREWRHVGAGADINEDAPTGRTRFAGLVGIMSSALFTLLIFSNHLPTFFIDPCST
jgi:TRAP-type C4-dicarboxylate transport system permease small subunit